jgi:phage shock protein C
MVLIMESKKIYRSSSDSVFAGVCGGVGEYFNIDPVIVRIIWVVVTLIGGAGILGYIIAWVIIPLKDDGLGKEKSSKGCLYAILILLLAGLAVATIGPIINFFIGFASFGVNNIMSGWNYSYYPFNSGALTQIILMAWGGLVVIVAIAIIIYLIRKAGKKD